MRVGYRVIKSPRRSLSLSVAKSGEVVVRAPLGLGDKEIEAFVMRHTRWIERRLADRAHRFAPNLSDGAEIFLCGKKYTIAEGAPRLIGDFLFLPRDDRAQALVQIMKELTAARMTALVRSVASAYGFSFRPVGVTSARTRWGSCSAKKINFTFRTAFLPDPLARYLAVHELCHTKEMNHGSRFWKEVGRILPDYAALRFQLRHDYQWAMECL